MAQENRALSAQEQNLKILLKARLLAIAAIKKIKWRQRSRLIWMKTVDANTKLFHLRANGRRRKNHIPFLHKENRVLSAHNDKAVVLLDHFNARLGIRQHSGESIKWDFLNIPAFDLRHLDQPFELEELQATIKDMAAQKALGPDGFISLFKKCWHTVKLDLLNAINQLSALNGHSWSLLNTAYIVLIPKKTNALKPEDYRQISPIHSAAKILGNLLANRVAPELQNIISVSQSAFLKGRCIQDNFLYVKNTIQSMQREKKQAIFLKLDIAKAFDSLNWDYLLDVLKHVGFSRRFHDLICIALASTSSRILLNGPPGKPFVHHCGLRQGDPLSPLLFVLAIDPLQRIL